MQTIYFEDMREGDVFWGDEVAVDPDEMMAYNLRNDPWPIHVDHEAAAKSPFGGVIASGGYTITLLYRSLLGVYNNADRRWAFLGGFDWKLAFTKPVRPSDALRARMTILNLRPSSKPGRGVLTNLVELINQDDEVVLRNEVVQLLASRPD
jgi:acyl dehydratase